MATYLALIQPILKIILIIGIQCRSISITWMKEE